MEQQSTSATPHKQQDFVQYSPQIVSNYNQQFDHHRHHQAGSLGSPTQEHFEDSMLELKDVDTLPSNYAFVSHQHQQQQQPSSNLPVVMMQPPVYLPVETQQRVYETPSNNNYIQSSGLMMNPNVSNHNQHHNNFSSVEPSSYGTNKYTTWTRVVMIFAILLGIYGCFGLVSQLFMFVSMFAGFSAEAATTSVASLVVGVILSVLEIASGAVGVWSTVTKNPKQRKSTTIAHLALLSVTVAVNIIAGVIVNLQVIYQPTDAFAGTGVNPQYLVYIVIFSILLYVLLIFACCGSCVGCQAYRFKLMSNLQDDVSQPAQGEGFMVMRDEV